MIKRVVWMVSLAACFAANGLIGNAWGEEEVWGGLDSIFESGVNNDKPKAVKPAAPAPAANAAAPAASAPGAAAQEPQAEPVAETQVHMAFAYETAVSRAVDGIRVMASKDPDCWLVPPQSTRKVVDWLTRTVDIRYRETMVKIPIYEYETYEVLEPGKTIGQLVKVKKQRVKGIKGYNEEKRLVQDKDGPITRTHTYRVPVYEKDEAVSWHWGTIGANAMLIYALRQTGVPGSDGLLMPTAQGLSDFVDSFEMPDSTWDLAWLTAAFAVLPGDKYAALTERCASKLMDGQVANGDCAGMWGPVAINPAVVSVLLRAASQLSDYKSMASKAARANPQAGRKVQRQAAKAEEDAIRLDVALMDLQKESWRASQCGLLADSAMGTVKIEAFNGQVAYMQGVPYLFYNQTLVDMESTALALFALRVAAANKRLPAKTWRPQLLVEGRSIAKPGEIPAPRNASEVIRLAMQVVSRTRQPNGSWNEVNRQQAVKDFAWFSGVPQVKGAMPPLRSQSDDLSSLRGLVAYNSGMFFQRMSPVALPFDNDIFARMFEEMANTVTPERSDDGQRANAGRALTLGMLLCGARVPGEAPPYAALPAWRAVADKVLKRQDANTALWGIKDAVMTCFSTGIWARKADLSEAPPGKFFEKLAEPHLKPVFVAKAPNYIGYYVPNWPVNTAAALMILAEGLGTDWTLETEGVEYAPPAESAPAP